MAIGGCDLSVFERGGWDLVMAGTVVGLLYGCAAGFAAGWTFAALRNRAVRTALRRARARAARAAERRFLDYV